MAGIALPHSESRPEGCEIVNIVGCVVGAILWIGVAPGFANAQAWPISAAESRATPTAAADDAATSEPGVAARFLRDVGSDYKNFFSAETAWWLGAGGGAAWAVHAADQSIAD